MTQSSSQAPNPFYWLLLLTSVVFVVTALAYAVVPVLEQKARDAGMAPPPSPWRDALRRDGWLWLLIEVALVIVFSLLSMVWDRLTSLRGRASTTIMSSADSHPPSPDQP
ncbi:MAG: hypothetical protein NZ700_05725 [Gemmataceae bacterium]|nr:hypothetical protein [Gemmataceae bacterium]MDW8264761.1 hypothetical protein [Gemmataceae bacterium]